MGPGIAEILGSWETGTAFLGLSALSFALSYLGSSVGLMLGHVRLPLLVYFLGSAATGAGTNLAVSSLGAVMGSYRHAREGRVDWRLLLIVGVPSAIAAFLCARLMARVSSVWPQAIVGVMLVVSGVELAFRKKTAAATHVPAGRRRLLIEALIGALFGALAGAVGLMMGSLRLTSMIKFLGLDPRVAVGTNLAIGCLTGLLGAAGAWSASSLHVPTFVVVGLATAAGASLGAKATGRMSHASLNRLAGAVVIVLGVLMIAPLAWQIGAPDADLIVDGIDAEGLPDEDA